jgi:hypothetical protein
MTQAGGEKMAGKGVFTKTLAVIGTVLVVFPLLAPVLISLVRLANEARFQFDYLIPAEMFQFALGGGLLLLWASLRSRSRVKLIAWALGAAVVLLVGSQALAVVTGLASGATEPVGLVYGIVLTALLFYALALVAVGVGGVLLLRDVFRKEKTVTTPDPTP